jgi:hypothetical protein
VLLRVRSVPSRAVETPSTASGGANEPLEIGPAPQPAFTCRDMDAIDLYGRVHVGAPGGGDRVGRRERAGRAPRPARESGPDRGGSP